MSETTETLKHAYCRRCGYEEGIKYEDRYKKICPKCLRKENVMEVMRMIAIRFIDPEEPAALKEDYKDWDGTILGKELLL